MANTMATTDGFDSPSTITSFSMRRPKQQPHETFGAEMGDVDDKTEREEESAEEPNSPYSRETAPLTPAESTCDSPLLKHPYPQAETRAYRQNEQLPQAAVLDRHPRETAVRLPSIHEFEQGVQSLYRRHEARRCPNPASLFPGSSSAPFDAGASHHHHHHHHHRQQPATPQSIPSLGSPSLSVHDDCYSEHSSRSPQFGHNSPKGWHGSLLTPPPEDPRHINKKYSTEEGDYIIYALHDQKLKWASITRNFADLFGRHPARTTSGLQAWYYRMNQRIPVWDHDGWLIFDKLADEEPRTVAIKCRQKLSEGMGLVRRYPERLVDYHWAEEYHKQAANDWARKRRLQYIQREHARKVQARL